MNIKDLTGNRYGRLFILGPTNQRQHRCIVYKCKCTCGNIVFVRSDSLRSGNTKSCGCLHQEVTSLTAKQDLIGQRFGRLVVIEDTKARKFGGIVWKCRCDCGNIVNIRANALKSKHTKSCGCLQRDIASYNLAKIMSNSNHWNWKGGISSKNERYRNLAIYDSWRKSIFSKDNYTCYKCKSSKDIVAHHIESFADNITLRFDIGNGVTLCSKCHNLFHDQYGRGQNTREQFDMFTDDVVEFIT